MNKSRKLLLACCLIWSSSAQGAQFYVSPKGKDKNSGTKESPWRTPQHAVEMVRQLRATSPGEPVTVWFGEGRYEMSAPLRFTAADSGSEKAPVVYAAAPGEKPVLSGSTELKLWRTVTDKAVLDRLDAAVRHHVYVADLTKAGITDYGDPTTPGKRPELFCNGKLQTLARWPNEEFAYTKKLLGATPVPDNWAHFTGTKEGIFAYTDPRQDRWAGEPDARLGGYWFWDWLDEYQRVEKVDTATRTIYIAQPYHASGYKDGLRYRGVNLLCELDSPGEWYLDRSAGLIYWYPSVPAAVDNRVTLTRFDEPYMVEMEGCTHLTLRGLSFEESRGSGIRIVGGANCLIDGCRLSGMGCDAIRIENGTGHGVANSLAESLGLGGIEMTGGDRKTLTPSGHFVENCIVRNFSTFKRTYAPAVHVTGCGFRIAHNLFERSSSSAMRYEGNDIVVEYNVIRNVVNESDDQGGIESYYNPTYRGIVVRYNHWSDIYGGTFSGATGVRMDDMICGIEVFGNIFERCGSYTFGGVQINGGKENVIENNLFYRCQAAVSFTSMWSQQRWESSLDTLAEVRKKMFEEVDINSEVYKRKYPALQQLREGFNQNTIKDNLVVDCPEVLMTGHDGNAENNARQILENNTKIEAGRKTLRELCAPQFLKLYGLAPIPLSEMGPKGNPWQE